MSDPERLSEQDLDELLNIEWLNYYDMKDTKTTVEEMAAAIRQLRQERDEAIRAHGFLGDGHDG